MVTPGEDFNHATESEQPTTWPKAITTMVVGFLIPCALLVNMNTIAMLAKGSNEFVVYSTVMFALAASGFLVRIGASNVLGLCRQRD